MKLQPASKKEVARMAFYCSICAALELAGLLILSLVGIGTFSFRTILGAVGGTGVAIGNFAMMCLMIQNAAGIQDQKLLRAKVQGSYNLRIFVQAGWVAIAFFVPWINVIAAVIPLLFPTAVIYYLQLTGKLMPPSSESPAPRKPADEEETGEDSLNSFEV